MHELVGSSSGGRGGKKKAETLENEGERDARC